MFPCWACLISLHPTVLHHTINESTVFAKRIRWFVVLNAQIQPVFRIRVMYSCRNVKRILICIRTLLFKTTTNVSACSDLVCTTANCIGAACGCSIAAGCTSWPRSQINLSNRTDWLLSVSGLAFTIWGEQTSAKPVETSPINKITTAKINIDFS